MKRQSNATRRNAPISPAETDPASDTKNKKTRHNANQSHEIRPALDMEPEALDSSQTGPVQQRTPIRKHQVRPIVDKEVPVNQENLKKLNKILFQKWNQIQDELQPKTLADNGRQVIEAHVKWRQVCDSLGIEGLRRMGDEFHPGGELLEESVVLGNPAFYGTWLQIPNDTAEKILVMGMP